MTKLAPEWVRTSDPVIRSPARYRWTTAPAYVKRLKQKSSVYRSEMARNAIESDFRTSKMAAGGHFVNKIIKLKLWHRSEMVLYAIKSDLLASIFKNIHQKSCASDFNNV